MARTNNLTNFLTDVANAIRTKKGTETDIPAADFDTEILALPAQGVYESRTINITQNGSRTITPNQGYDAIDELIINTNVPTAQLQTKNYTFTQNTTTTLSPETGYDGFSSVGLTINIPEGTKRFSSIAAMEASSPSVGDYAYVYNTEMEGLYQYQTITDVIPIPHKTAINPSTSPVTYTASNNDVYVNATKLVAVINKLITDYGFQEYFFLRPRNLTVMSVTIINDKIYAILANGSGYYRTVNNGYLGSTANTDLYVGMGNMTSNRKLLLWELDLDNTTYQQPIELNFSGYSGNIYYYNFTNMVCNHCLLNVTKTGTITLPTYFYDASSYTSKSTGTVNFNPSDINKWVLQSNSKYLDTSDATATANDINIGKVAYVDGNRITGVSNIFNIETDVKRYDTKADLDAVHDIPLGTKGVVYGGDCLYPIGNKSITNFYAPSTIILNEALTSDCKYHIRIKYSNGGSESTPIITPTGFTIRMSGYKGSGSSSYPEITIPYTSEDGITYTRGTITNSGFIWDSETDILSWEGIGDIQEVILSDVDADCGKLIKTFVPTLGGIYEFQSYTENTGVTHARNLADIIVEGITTLKYNCLLHSAMQQPSYPLVLIGTVQRYKSIENCVITTVGYQYSSSSCILYDSTKNKYYFGQKGTITGELDDTYLRSYAVSKYTPNGFNTEQVHFRVNELEYKKKSSSTQTTFFVPFLEISDLTQAYIINTSAVTIWDATLTNTGNSIAATSGATYLSLSSYLPCETQMTVASNSELLPGKVAIGKDGEIYIGDNTIFDNLPISMLFGDLYNTQRINDNLYNGYDFYNIASMPNTHQIQYAKIANSINTFQDGLIGVFDEQIVYSLLSISLLEKYGSYNTIRFIGCSIKYNCIVTINYDSSSYNARFVVYDYDTKAIIYHSDEFRFQYNYTKTVSFINEDQIVASSSKPGENITLCVLDLRDFSFTKLLNLTGDYWLHDYGVIICGDYIIYSYYTNYSQSSTATLSLHIYNTVTKDSPQNITSYTAAVSSWSYINTAADSTDIYIVTSSKIIKYNKNSKSIIYNTTYTGSSLVSSANTSYIELSDNLPYFFINYYMIDKATGTTYNRVNIRLIDNNDEVVATTESSTNLQIPVYEKNGKYYALINGILGIGTIESITDVESTDIKLFIIKCEKIYHVPVLVYKNEVQFTIQTFYYTRIIYPSSFSLNNDNSITYQHHSHDCYLTVTANEYEISNSLDYEYAIIRNNNYSSTYGYPSANIVLQKPAQDISL